MYFTLLRDCCTLCCIQNSEIGPPQQLTSLLEPRSAPAPLIVETTICSMFWWTTMTADILASVQQLHSPSPSFIFFDSSQDLLWKEIFKRSEEACSCFVVGEVIRKKGWLELHDGQYGWSQPFLVGVGYKRRKNCCKISQSVLEGPLPSFC